MTDTLIVDRPIAGARFSLSLAVAGGIAAAAVTFVVLTLGAGFGLLLVRHATVPAQAPTFLTGGGLYFLAAQAFGFAVGGYIVGRVLGPAIESRTREDVRAAAHGLVAWAVTILSTIVIVAVAGLALSGAGVAAAALYGASQPKPASAGPTAYVVDRLFRPERDTGFANNASESTAEDNAAQSPGQQIQQPAQAGADAYQRARSEAERLLQASVMRGGRLDGDDRSRLVMLVSQQAAIPPAAAAGRVDSVQSDIATKIRNGAETARKFASYASLWVAFSFLFGALVAMASAIAARIEDDREGPAARVDR
jgi:hypothetical protein